MSYQDQFERDTIPTSVGNLEITFLGHGSVMFVLGDTVIQVDPYSRVADYSKLPQADIVLVTHEHHDHLDSTALAAACTGSTHIVLTEACAGEVEGGIVMRNGDKRVVKGVAVEAVPAYNIVHRRGSGQPYHPQGAGNGYILGFGDTRVYLAGDTENIPEMATLGDIDIAFLPMNVPYTMSPEMAAEAALAIQPSVVYPYHFGDSDPQSLIELLVKEPGIEVRIRRMA